MVIINANNVVMSINANVKLNIKIITINIYYDICIALENVN